MNRPIYNNTHILDDSIMAYDCEYRKDLEKYCDFLEWKIETLNEALHDHILALDKACMQLEMLDERNGIPADEWREWALKDEHI